MNDDKQMSPAAAHLFDSAEFCVIAEHELRRARRDGDSPSIVVAKIDRRGPVVIGDGAVDPSELRALGDLVALELRASDVVALTDSGELALLLPDTSPDGVAVVVQHLATTIEELAASGRTNLVARLGWSSADPADSRDTVARLMQSARAGATAA